MRPSRVLASARSLRRLGLALGMACLACLGFAPLAHADVWAYVDARGITHFASEQLDERYELFFRGGSPGGAASAEIAAAEAAEALAAAHADRRSEAGLSAQGLAGYGSSPYAMRLASYIEGTAGYQFAKPLLQEAARSHRIDEELLKALIATESGFDPQAVSPKGAIGLMQVMPATAERFGLSGDARQPLARKLAEPQHNIRTGARYLRFLMNLFPDQLELALAAYNAGEGAVQRAGNRIPNIKETQNYVRTVMQLYALLKPPAPPVAVSTPAAAATPPAPVRPAMPGAVPGRASMPPSLASAPPLLLPPVPISKN